MSEKEVQAGIEPPKIAEASHPPIWKHAHASHEELDGYRHAYAAAISNAKAAVCVDPEASALRLRAERDTGIIALALSGAFPEMPRKSDGSFTTRKEQLKEAWDHRDRAIADTLPAALAAVMKLPASPARDISADHLSTALYYVKGINPALDYLDPTPQELLTLTIGDGKGGTLTETQTEPAVVGPHGNYWLAISQAFWMTHYCRDTIEVVQQMIAGGKYGAGKRKALEDIQSGMYGEIQRWHYDCAGKVAGVVDDPADRFCSMLYVGDTLWSSGPKPGLPRWYFHLLVTLSEIATDNKVLRALFKAQADMWLQSNRVIEGIFMEAAPLRKRCQKA